MNELFKAGFEKIAVHSLIHKGVKGLGRLTGVSQFRTGRKQAIRGLQKGQIHPMGTTKPELFGPEGSVNKRLLSSYKRMGATGLVAGGTAYGIGKARKKNK